MCSKWLLYVGFVSRDFESPFLLLNKPSLLVNTSSPEYESAFIFWKAEERIMMSIIDINLS